MPWDPCKINFEDPAGDLQWLISKKDKILVYKIKVDMLRFRKAITIPTQTYSRYKFKTILLLLFDDTIYVLCVGARRRLSDSTSIRDNILHARFRHVDNNNLSNYYLGDTFSSAYCTRRKVEIIYTHTLGRYNTNGGIVYIMHTIIWCIYPLPTHDVWYKIIIIPVPTYIIVHE